MLNTRRGGLSTDIMHRLLSNQLMADCPNYYLPAAAWRLTGTREPAGTQQLPLIQGVCPVVLQTADWTAPVIRGGQHKQSNPRPVCEHRETRPPSSPLPST